MTPSLLTPPTAARSAAKARIAPTPGGTPRTASLDELADRLASTTTQAKKAAARKKAAAKKRARKVPVCTAKDLKKKPSKRRKCRVVKPAARTNPAARNPSATSAPKVTPTTDRPSSPSGPVAAPPVTAPTPDAWTPLPTPSDTRTDGIRAYTGAFGIEQATRLLFRGGFGPLPGQAEEFAALGLKGSVARLMNPGPARLEGPEPSGGFLVGGAFAPEDRWGHGHLQWLDRVARSTDQLGERMTLILHDWLAINGEVGAKHMVRSIDLLRSGWRGSMRQLMLDITVDPAMLIWLNGLWSGKWSPNENYAREVMELFCLGADRGAYTEADIRELARAFTGWIADWSDAQGVHNVRFDANRWDSGEKVFFRGTSYERRGKFGWRDTINAVIDHPMHPSYVVLKLWGAFIPTPPTPLTLAELEALYRSSGERLEPLVEAILQHPDLYTGPSVTKSPITLVGGMLRARRRGIDDEAWTWICDSAGQMLWDVPNVSGWNEKAWLNTTTYSARWYAVANCVRTVEIPESFYQGGTETPEQAVEAALTFWGNPVISAAHRAVLLQHARDAMTTFYWGNASLQRTMRQYSLRQLVAAAPDYQVS